MTGLRGQAAIVGVGTTPVGNVPELNSVQLHIEAAKAALKDSGLERDSIDGLMTFNSMTEPIPMFHAEAIAEQLGLSPHYLYTGAVGGAQPLAAVHHAAAAVSYDLCNYVLIICADNLFSGLQGHWTRTNNRAPEVEQFEFPYGATTPATYALYARAHMAAYGTTSEQLAAVAVACRKHASLRDTAQMRTPITIDDVLSSRLIGDPLHLLDCSLVSDGGAAWIVTKAERAPDSAKKPVYLLGAGEANWHHSPSHIRSLLETPAKDSGARAFAMAGLRPSDVDVAELYDCFTPMPIIQLEDLGFCKKGEGGAFVEGGRIEVGGELPIITHGGLLSHAHPGFPGSSFNVVEAVRQLRGECGAAQVKGAEIALAQGQGGSSSTHTTLIFGTEP
jgi:acetyl-CoA acetyltransferase